MKKNFGYGRRMDWSGKQVLIQRFGGGHYSSVATHSDRWSRFCQFAKDNGVKDMRAVDEPLVRRYAASIEHLSASTQQNMISTINVVMGHAGEGQWHKLSPRQLTGVARSNIRTTAPTSLDRTVHQRAVDKLQASGQQRAAAVAALARELGARSEEAIKANLFRWQREADALGKVNIVDGCKGGRNAPRWIAITDRGRQALDAALAARPTSSNNLLSLDESYVQALEGWIRDGRETYGAATGAKGFHDARSAFACERYRALTHTDAPVVAGKRVISRAADLSARETIAYELGHERYEITNSYIGGRR